ncbi:hypothetical protein [Myxococcus faecalis]|uniref:hypothetical protein n=1 Tax=Myxococcus faecalis TaxID=3115646 RepID=UPI003CEED6DB
MNHLPRRLVFPLLVSGVLVSCGPPPESRNDEGTPPEAPARTEQALLTLASCPVGSGDLNYAPPLRNERQDVGISGTSVFSNCLALLDPALTSATYTVGNLGASPFSCLDLLEVGRARGTLVWNTGETSTLVQTRVAARVEGLLLTLTHVGSVEAGKFQGATVLRTTTFLSTDLDACSGPEGLRRLSGPSTITFLGLL